MKYMVAIVCLAFVACALGADSSSPVISQTNILTESTEKLADLLKKFLDSGSKDVAKESKDRLKEVGTLLVEAEGKLAEQVIKLGHYLGLDKELPTPKAP